MARAIFGPTVEEMLHPSAIDPAIRMCQAKDGASDKLSVTGRNQEAI